MDGMDSKLVVCLRYRYNPKKFYGKPYEQYWSTRGEVEGEAPAHATHGQRGYTEGLRKDGAALDTLQSTYMPPTPASGKQVGYMFISVVYIG